MTNFIQPIDAGLGRCVRVSIGFFLDKWLVMDDDNMEKWETNAMTAPERRIFISELVGAKVMEYVMTDDTMAHMRISAFRRTGCLITKIPNETHDKEIKPQGMPLGSFTVPTERNNELEDEQDEDEENPIEPMDDNDAVLAEEELMLDEYREVDEGSAELEQENELVCHEFLSDNEEDNGDVIDDNEEDVE